MSAYYNENDPNAAAWLRQLIYEGQIAWGEVDERSIVDVRPREPDGYTQCHFFAGIGGWSHALRLAGWPDERPVWTGSCPCQPFSVAGKGEGKADERHLWPAWFNLIRECNPPKIFGEQVEAAIRHGWLDLVYSNLEGIGYAVGAVVIPAAGVGAPHIRQRLWFVADAPDGDGRRGERAAQTGIGPDGLGRQRFAGRGAVGELADAQARGFGIDRGASRESGHAAQRDAINELGNAEREGLERHAGHGDDAARRAQPVGSTAPPGELSHYWRSCDWLPCRDGKARPVEPGTFPLAHGVPGRVVKLRAYGNAIVPQVAAAFIRASE